MFQYFHNQGGSASVFQLNICLGSIKNFFSLLSSLFKLRALQHISMMKRMTKKEGKLDNVVMSESKVRITGPP